MAISFLRLTSLPFRCVAQEYPLAGNLRTNLNRLQSANLQVPIRFRWVVEQTLREFFKAIQVGKDVDPSWKKQIYKIIARLDDYVPEYFKTQAFLDQLE